MGFSSGHQGAQSSKSSLSVLIPTCRASKYKGSCQDIVLTNTSSTVVLDASCSMPDGTHLDTSVNLSQYPTASLVRLSDRPRRPVRIVQQQRPLMFRTQSPTKLFEVVSQFHCWKWHELLRGLFIAKWGSDNELPCESARYPCRDGPSDEYMRRTSTTVSAIKTVS